MPPHILFARFLYNQQDRLHKAAAHYDLLRSRNLSELERLGLQVCAYLCVFGGGRAHTHTLPSLPDQQPHVPAGSSPPPFFFPTYSTV